MSRFGLFFPPRKSAAELFERTYQNTHTHTHTHTFEHLQNHQNLRTTTITQKHIVCRSGSLCARVDVPPQTLPDGELYIVSGDSALGMRCKSKIKVPTAGILYAVHIKAISRADSPSSVSKLSAASSSQKMQANAAASATLDEIQNLMNSAEKWSVEFGLQCASLVVRYIRGEVKSTINKKLMII